MVEAVDGLPMVGIKVNHRGTGDKQYPPAMMLSLLIYGYATELPQEEQAEYEAKQAKREAARILSSELKEMRIQRPNFAVGKIHHSSLGALGPTAIHGGGSSPTDC